jgi:Domain of unknown function DUF11
LRSDVAGSNSISARVMSDNDASLANNSGDGALLIDSEADVGVALQGPTSAVVGAEFNVSFTVANPGPSGVGAVQVAVTLPAGVMASRAEFANGACAVAPSGVQCTLASLSADGSATGVVAVTAASAGNVTLRAGVSGNYVDPQPANDSAEHVLSVMPASPAAAQNAGADPGGTGGGGGAVSLALLLGLAGLQRTRRRRHS